MNAKHTTLSTLHRLVATAVGASAIAIGALALSAPANALTIQQSCETNPGAYASGAVRGVYSTARRGWDRDQICKVYGVNANLLGTYIATDYGYYKTHVVEKYTPAPVLSSR
jgi:hypothetical protein